MKTALAEASITVPRKQAREKVAEYLRGVRGRHLAEDEQILRGYRALARGHAVIDLPRVIKLGGVFEATGLPRIAIGTADMDYVNVLRDRGGSVTFQPGARIHHDRRKDVYRCPVGTLPAVTHNDAITLAAATGDKWGGWNGAMRARTPHVPPSLRPNHSLGGYAVLFEVEEWSADPAAPADPALLKHIGGDLYAVLATWDLTPLEQSVLNGIGRG